MTALPLTRHPWMDAAACLTADPETFYPHESDRAGAARAKAICATCPVTDACLAEAVKHNDDWAVRGGLTPAERRAVKRRARKPVWGDTCAKGHDMTGANAYVTPDRTRRACRECRAQWRTDRKVG